LNPFTENNSELTVEKAEEDSGQKGFMFVIGERRSLNDFYNNSVFRLRT